MAFSIPLNSVSYMLTGKTCKRNAHYSRGLSEIDPGNNENRLHQVHDIQTG
jgi:hypothetical protein